VCLLDVLVLRGLVAATQQDDEDVAVVQVVDPVARAHIESELGRPLADRPHIAWVALGEAVEPTDDTCLASMILQLVDPCLELVGPENFEYLSTIADTYVLEQELPAGVSQPDQGSADRVASRRLSVA
jgi:hypothetical protein